MPLSSLAQRVLPLRASSPADNVESNFCPQTTFDDYFDETPISRRQELALELRRVKSDAKSVSTGRSLYHSRRGGHASFSSTAQASVRRVGSSASRPETLHSVNFGHAYDRMVPSSPTDAPRASEGFFKIPEATSAASLLLRVASLGISRASRRPDRDSSAPSSPPEPSNASTSQGSLSDAPSHRRVKSSIKRWCARCRDRLSF